VADPEIAVIIGAYRRTTYLLDAVRSVLAQDLARDRYEVLVTKNFESPEIDRALRELGVPAILDNDPRIGPWLTRAVGRTRAPLVAFLDDDDEFEPHRLREVLRLFDEHPELGFYRNRVRVIDAAGAPVPADRWRSHELDTELDRTGPVLVPAGPRPDLVALALDRTHVTFNSSTMVVRRELLTGPSGEAFRTSQLPDLALFLAAALAPTALYLDDRRLTRFRFYGDNVTHQVRWLGHAAEAHRTFAALSRSRGEEGFARWFDREAVHFDRLYLGGRIVEAVDRGDRRRALAQLGAEYLRFLARHPGERAWTLAVWGSEGYAVLYLLAPRLAQRTHGRQARTPAG